MTFVIRDMPADDRPRERLLQHGAETLSDAELLAVIIGTGAPGKNAIHLARELLDGGVRSLRERDLSSLLATRGMGHVKMARIAAVLEMSRRLAVATAEQAPTFDAAILGAQLVSGYGHHTQERLGAAALDSRHRVKKQKEIFVGTLDHALVSAREIVRFALLEKARGVVVFHNHPSGDPAPSSADVQMTRQINDVARPLGITVHDHIIIGKAGHASMRGLKLI